MNTADTLEEDELTMTISGYAEAQRGSNQLWDFFIQSYLKYREGTNVDVKLLVAKSLIAVDIPHKNIVGNDLREALRPEGISRVTE